MEPCNKAQEIGEIQSTVRLHEKWLSDMNDKIEKLDQKFEIKTSELQGCITNVEKKVDKINTRLETALNLSNGWVSLVKTILTFIGGAIVTLMSTGVLKLNI